MLDDIRNSTLLTMISAVVMAVVTIALSPEPPRDAMAAPSGGFRQAACRGGATTPAAGFGGSPIHTESQRQRGSTEKCTASAFPVQPPCLCGSV